MSDQGTVTRREAVKRAGAITAAAAVGPFVQKALGQNNQVQYGFIGTGSRGQYLLQHLNSVDNGRCVAACDIYEPNLKKAIEVSKWKPQGYKDYRELLARKDVDAVLIATPLYAHFPVTKDALDAGKHVFCEKSLVFKPEEVHALRALHQQKPKQVLQVGLQRRYSKFYHTAKQMIDKGMIGKVTHAYAQWNRNPGWTMKPEPRRTSWRLFKDMSGGLTAELASHQIDVADWFFGAQPEFVVGVGGNEFVSDGRTVYDNIQLIFKYPKGQKLMYSSISTNKHLSMFGGARTEFGEIFMGTEGTIEITVGTDNEPAIGLWYYEPGPKPAETAKKKEEPVVVGATLAATGGGARPLPILFERDTVTGKESFLERELKFARLWLYKKGIMMPEEDRNPVDVSLESFFNCCRTGQKPNADTEVGLADSTMVILANQAMDEGRRVFFNEIDKPKAPEAKPAAAGARRT
jgi:predicted dehydrogenase